MKYRVMTKTSPLYIYGWPLWLAKEWFNRGHGEGKRGPQGKLP